MPAQAQTPTSWTRSRTGSIAGLGRFSGWIEKLASPTYYEEPSSKRVSPETFWPATLDKECDKASRILKSFCKDGFFGDDSNEGRSSGSIDRGCILKHIPTEVIQNARGIVVFTAMRANFWISGAGGSGVVIAQKPDGSWSPPSAVMLHAPLLCFSPGVDLYDCILVINTDTAMNYFLRPRFTLENETKSSPGPVTAQDVYMSTTKAQVPVYSYAKSKGSLESLYMDGLIVIERMDENERFYSEPMPAAKILTGELRYPTKELKMLMETLKLSQGNTNFAERLLTTEPSPSDHTISQDGQPAFGIPDYYDPDPFGVMELENAGIAIKEAGTHRRASSEQFHFQPKVTSPIYGAFRRSMDSKSLNRQLSWVNSRSSLEHHRRTSSMTDSATQTDVDSVSVGGCLNNIPTPRALSPKSSFDLHSRNGSVAMGNIPEIENESTDETAYNTPSNKYDSPISSTSPVSDKSEAVEKPLPAPTQPSTLTSTAPSMSVDDINKLRIQLDQIKTFGRTPDPQKQMAPPLPSASTASTAQTATAATTTTNASTDTTLVTSTASTATAIAAPPTPSATSSTPVAIEVPKRDDIAKEEVATPISIPRARLVTVAKRTPPKLPPRNPSRAQQKPSAVTAESPKQRESLEKGVPISDVEVEERVREQREEIYDVSPKSMSPALNPDSANNGSHLRQPQIKEPVDLTDDVQTQRLMNGNANPWQ